MFKRCCLLVALVSLCIARGASAQDGYRTARVSDVQGELAVRGEDEDDVSYLERNAIIRPGDVLWTDDRSNAEIELERGAWVRLAEDTKLEVRELPPSGEFRLWTGSVYVDVSERVGEPLRLQTPAGDVDIFPESVVRIDLAQEDSARVSVFSGRAVALGDGGRDERLESGDRLYLEAGRVAEAPGRFNREDLDGFDRYNRQRVDYYVSRPLPRDLEQPIIGAYDLADYGAWVTIENERYWRPRCDDGWRPYSRGYWSWSPGCGYSWIDYEPWGYTTCHYGRWQYRPVYGWLWCPRYTWSPAWVYWSNCDSYYGWAPLDPWDRPCYYGRGSGFSIGFGGADWFIDFRSWSFCDRNDFFFGRHHRRWGGRGFYAGHEIRLDPGRFHLTRDAVRDFGAPRERFRGLLTGNRGSARDRVLHVEDRIPQRRQELIRNRFGVPGDRDRRVVREIGQRGGDLERLQRDRGTRIDDNRLVRGDEAQRLLRSPRSDRDGSGGLRRDTNRESRGGNDRGADDRVGRLPRGEDGGARAGGNRDRESIFDRVRERSRSGRDSAGTDRSNGTDRGGDGVLGGGRSGDDRFRRGGDRSDGPSGAGRGGEDPFRRGGNRGGDIFSRKEEPSPPTPPRPPKGSDDRGGDRGGDRDSIFRRGSRGGDDSGRSGDSAGRRGPDRSNTDRSDSPGGRGSVFDRQGRDSTPRSDSNRDRSTPGRRSYTDFPPSGSPSGGDSEDRIRRGPFRDFPSTGSPSTGSEDRGRRGGSGPAYRDFPGPSGGGSSAPRSYPGYERDSAPRSFPRSGGDSPAYGGRSGGDRPSFSRPYGGGGDGGRSYSRPSDSGGSYRGGGGSGGYSRPSGGGGGGSRGDSRGDSGRSGGGGGGVFGGRGGGRGR